VEIRKAYLAMIKAFPGGWDAIAAALGFTRDALENRIYERKGQGLLVDTAMQMQATTGTTHFAQAVAQASGGYFVPMPAGGEHDRQELLAKFNELYAKLGELSVTFKDAIEDDEIKPHERAALNSVGQQIHASVEGLLGLTFQIYCRKPASDEVAP
jgi:hypothetical protein